MTSPITLTPKRTVHGWKHIIWAIHRKNQCNGSTWVHDPEKKDSITKKSHKGYISPIWGEAPAEPIRPKVAWWVMSYDLITCAQFQIEIFMGYDFRGGQIFDFPIDFLHGPYNSTALMHCLWCLVTRCISVRFLSCGKYFGLFWFVRVMMNFMMSAMITARCLDKLQLSKVSDSWLVHWQPFLALFVCRLQRDLSNVEWDIKHRLPTHSLV